MDLFNGKFKGLVFYISFLLVLLSARSFAHPMDNSIILLNIGTKNVQVELQLPLDELQFAVPFDVTFHTETLIERQGSKLRTYLSEHFRPTTLSGIPWKVTISNFIINRVKTGKNRSYQELVAYLKLEAPEGVSTKNFILNYDIIIHQVTTHAALVKIQDDWENGINAENPSEVGVIAFDALTNTIPPFEVRLGGNVWKGFTNMIKLGFDHIKEGIDHLLFLLVLLLPAPLLNDKRKWAQFGGVKFSLIRLLKIVTAFTLGHSITLLLSALGWVEFPVKPVEIIIAFSILICAFHAIRPLFPGKEMFIAAIFGLFHGLAFANSLNLLNLDSERMLISILGFNIGIELMQLFVAIITMPWLILLSRTTVYKYIRITGAGFAIIASLSWIYERASDTTSQISNIVKTISGYSLFILLFLMLMSVILFVRQKPGTIK